MTTAEQGTAPSFNEVYISLAGALFVSWPMLDAPPATQLRGEGGQDGGASG